MERKEQNAETVRTSKQRNDHSKEQSVIILGDSMVKHLNGYEVLQMLQSKCKVYVRNFPGAKRRCMKDY